MLPQSCLKERCEISWKPREAAVGRRERLRATYEAHDKDVIEYVVPGLVATVRMMPKSVRPETVPTMAAPLIAAGTGLSPNPQYGRWTKGEVNALEATVVLLAEHLNRRTDDPGFATRLITEALSGTDEE